MLMSVPAMGAVDLNLERDRKLKAYILQLEADLEAAKQEADIWKTTADALLLKIAEVESEFQIIQHDLLETLNSAEQDYVALNLVFHATEEENQRLRKALKTSEDIKFGTSALVLGIAFAVGYLAGK